MIQMQLSQETGNVILLKDLTNIASAAKQGKSRNSVDTAVCTFGGEVAMVRD